MTIYYTQDLSIYVISNITMFQLQLDPFPSYSEKNYDLPLPVALAAIHVDVAMSFHLRPETDPVSEILFVVTDNRQPTNPVLLHVAK
jgi:hypothetical protein